MPTYEYACRKCGEHLEVVQSFTDDPLTECPACGGSLRKVFGSIGITFKGSGFYRTDSRAASTRTSSSDGAAKKESTTSTESGSSSTESSSSSTSQSSPASGGSGSSGTSGSSGGVAAAS